ncbi:tetratricopeptide (TPR) repeat protein [Kitasatospora sp. GP30]|uniref:PHD finger domain-containing protein n=1 Tax=Kitasatospora sp. GP30 TaxID=3035084 RepID=UPI000CBAD9F3|nr:PHD finger domain-containing protein [Kitasatospora sp. GP30]MDH6138347.1 tetratricopeptide (TPR) repeat protein [Kitasatospora sp. GP30]
MSEEQGAAGGGAVRPSLVLSRAARALAAGEYAQAVGLHRQLDTMRPGLSPQFLPARAAARGFLAARAGDWAASADWYAFVLDAHVEGLLPEPPAERRCRVQGCRRGRGLEPMLRCGQCHRLCCSEHGAARPGGPQRCDDCLWTALSNLTIAAVALDSPQTALPALTAWCEQGDWEDAGLLRDVLTGDPGAAAQLPAECRELGRVVLLRRAAGVSDRRDLLDRLSQLGQVDGLLAGPARELQAQAAQQATRRGDPAAAEEAWRRAWAAAPSDLALVHAAGLAALAAATAEPDPDRCAAAARRAIGCLAVTVNGGAYWKALAESTGRPLTDEEQDEVRIAFDEQLRLRLRVLDTRLARPAHQGLELAWTVETEAVRLLMELAVEAVGPPLETGSGSTLLGGPIFLTLSQPFAGEPLGVRPGGLAGVLALLREHLSWPPGREPQHSHPVTFLRLVEVASPNGPFLQLLAEKRFQEAIEIAEEELDATPADRRGDLRREELRHLLGRALLGRAKERLDEQDWQAAFEDYERAADQGAELKPHQADLEQATYQWGKELRRGDRSSWQSYAAVLNRALRLLPSRGLAENLEEALRRLPADYKLPPVQRPERARVSRPHAEPAPEAAAPKAARPRTEQLSPYLVLDVPPSADGSAVQAAYLRELKAAGRDAVRKKQVAAARSALSSPQRRRMADLLVPLPGLAADGGSLDELGAHCGRLAEQQAAALRPLPPALAQLIPLAP